ncbi:MAG: hypothetical protein MJ219_01285 [Mycoplasmoidaceae bacterium]|nr:hypothetical protein [Mycoplasmoidaceae bacterium]
MNKGYIEYLTSVCATYRVPYIVIDVGDKTVDEEMAIIDKELRERGIIK